MESYLILFQNLDNLIFHLLLVFLINLNFSLPHIAHFDNSIALSLIVSKTLGFMLSVFFLKI